MTRLHSSRLLKLATVTPLIDEKDTFIRNYNGSLLKSYGAPIIRALAKGLGVTFNIVMPEDDTFGYKKPDGTWTGIIGMLARGEADLSVSGLTMTEERRKAVNFTYPLHVTDFTFMTDKPEPHPKNFAVFDVFSLEVWIGILLSLILVSLFLYMLLKRKETYSTILIESIGCLLEQSFSFNVRQNNTVLLLFYWFIGVTVLTTSYKAVILSVITVPRMVGIRDISDLSDAAKQNSIKCISYKGFTFTSFVHWSESNDNRLKSVEECLNKSEIEGLHGQPAFLMYPHKKVFLADRVDITKLGRYYFISDDSFILSYLGIAYSKTFCCPRKLESIVHRIIAADLYPKLLRDIYFTAQLTPVKTVGVVADVPSISPLKLEDFAGTFLIFFAGHLFSLLIFIAEIVSKRFHSII